MFNASALIKSKDFSMIFGKRQTFANFPGNV
jgi:hypothetical protein